MSRIAPLLREVLDAGDKRGVQYLKGSHISETLLLEIAAITHVHMWQEASKLSQLYEGWRVHPGGILPWWTHEADLTREEAKRLHKFRSDVVDFLHEQVLAFRIHPQSAPLHVAPAPNDAAEAAISVTISEAGAGYGDPDKNRMVEQAAMMTVTNNYVIAGWSAEDVSGTKCGWDVTFTHPTRIVRHVEVKGVAGKSPSILLTRNEYQVAGQDPLWRIAIVTNALSVPTMTEWSATEVLRASSAYVYRVNL